MFQRNSSEGFSVVEIVIASALIAIIVTSAAGAWQLYLKFSNQTTGLTGATLLAEEGIEAMNFLRDQSWKDNIAGLNVNTDYYLYWNGNIYATSSSPQIIDGKYLRKFVVNYINRNSDYNFTSTSSSCGSSCDANSRYILMSVSMASSSQNLIQTEILVHNIFNN